ncbi:MAG: alpha-2-macroglobulin, partial [Candidatus Poribacteria bacterium]|nr:alpha-2-macroglobulin [Candidatus Poribacteria bacterium]
MTIRNLESRISLSLAGSDSVLPLLGGTRNDARYIILTYDIAQTYEISGRTEDAINSYKEFINLKYDPSMKESDKITVESFEQLRMSATYKIGEMLLGKKDYTGAIDTWNQYIAQFPNGPQWTDAQRGIVNAEYQIGVDLLAQEKYDEAVIAWGKFLEKHPLDDRSRQIMFAFGQLHYHSAEQAEEKKTDAEPEYRKAIAEWEKLVSKYPNTEESSLALFRIGQIYEEKLFDFEKALESYRKLTWGSWYGEAQNHIRSMTEKKLQLVTERIFRTNEPAKVKLTLRNIEKLTVDMYKLDLEAYWRKTHGIIGIENLDIALISPDKTQEYPIPEYKKYKLFEQYIEVPMDGPGVYAIHVSEDDLEATTLIIRSDIDAIVKTSRQEVLVFAEDMLKLEPVSKAKVLITDGTKVIGEGETGDDGVFQKKIDDLKNTNGVSAFIIKDGNIASNSLDISALGLSTGLTSRGYIYTDRPAYRPEQKVSISAIIRDVNEGIYKVTPDSVYELSIIDSQGRLLHSEDLKLSKFGTFNTEFLLDTNAPLGEYQIIAKSKDDDTKVYTGTFQVQRYQLEKMKLTIEFPRKVYFRGEKVEATFKAIYYYGQPVTNRMIRYTLPDGRSYTEQVDAEGSIKVTFDTTAMQPDTILTFSGTVEGENIPWTSDYVFLASLEFSISVKPSTEVAISGEPFNVSIETKGADGKPVGKELNLVVYRKVERPVHPILSQMPWFTNDGNFAVQRTSEIKVEEHKVVTDEKTGKGSISLKLDQGANYLLRASGTDRFNQPISSNEAYITISDDKDAVKLRIVAEQSGLKVGETVKIKIHSRLENSAVALLTFEGEGIISHKIQKLNKGWNDVDFTVGNEHFPNFRIAISAMSVEGKNVAPKLVTAEKDFTVERQLAISFKLKEFYAPGEEGEIEVTATDQLGKPVEAELSFALVEEALYALYPDVLMPITDFFKEGAQRYAGMTTVSSCTFRYEPPTRQVIKEMLEEADRLKRDEEQAKKMGEVLSLVEEEVSAVATNGLALAAPAPASMGRQMGARKASAKMRIDEKDKSMGDATAERYL